MGLLWTIYDSRGNLEEEKKQSGFDFTSKYNRQIKLDDHILR
jgi:hypothetical protein